jgi:hypothetical protein
VSFLGTGLPPPTSRGRRRGKNGHRKGPGATERLTLLAARRLQLAPKAPKARTEGACLEHAFESLGFSSAWALANFIDQLALRSRGKGNVRLPAWKCPRGVRAVVAIRCKACSAKGCTKCGQFGWGIHFRFPIPRTSRIEKGSENPSTNALG